ncbi:MAG TPA: peroxidase-related enzyme [Burkholderiales bacterium]|nr:peroxidase-related enzyme [Burkholderiales bacterium]
MARTDRKRKPAAGGKSARQFSWLRLPEYASREPAVLRLQKECRERLGFVRNFLKLPFGPGRLALYQGYLDRLMRGADGHLPPLERELLALVTSVENRCEVCILSHAAALKKHGMDRHQVDTLALAWRRAGLSPRHHALAEFASMLTLHPADVDATLMGRLRAAGFREEEILEAIQIVAIYNSNNRINNALGMQPNIEARPGYQPARAVTS